MKRTTTAFHHQRSNLPSTIQSIRRRLYWACFFFLIGVGLFLFVVGHYWINRRNSYPSPGTGLTLASQYTYLPSQITRINHSVVKIIPLTEDGLRPYPPFVEHHITRYSKGCVDDIIAPLREASYQVILPWVHQFDHLYTSCGIWWFAPRRLANTTCVYTMPDDGSPMHRYNPVKSFRASPVKSDMTNLPPVKSTPTHHTPSLPLHQQQPLRVHVSNELPRYHQHFLKSVLPYYEAQWRNGSISGVMVHSGSGDTPVPSRIAKAIVNSDAVVRWIVEQNVIESLADHPKVIQLPTGLCAARLYPVESSSSSSSTHSLPNKQRSDNDQSHRDHGHGQHIIHDGSPERGKNVTVSLSQPLPFEQRSDRVFFCFHTRYPHRQMYMNYALHQCTICDVCTHPDAVISANDSGDSSTNALSRTSSRSSHEDTTGSTQDKSSSSSLSSSSSQIIPSHLKHTLPIRALWKAYGQYKFVFSPWGNGPDCGRSWEIMLAGAIPIMEYYPGARGYLQGGLSIVIIRNETELSLYHQQHWLSRYKESNKPYRLRRRYWTKRAFGVTDVLDSIHPQQQLPLGSPIFEATDQTRLWPWLGRSLWTGEEY